MFFASLFKVTSIVRNLLELSTWEDYGKLEFTSRYYIIVCRASQNLMLHFQALDIGLLRPPEEFYS